MTEAHSWWQIIPTGADECARLVALVIARYGELRIARDGAHCLAFQAGGRSEIATDVRHGLMSLLAYEEAKK